MGLLDSLERTLNTVSRTTNAADNAISQAEKAKQISGKVGGALGKALEKKCRICKKPLKTELEKKKGICAECALSKM